MTKVLLLTFILAVPLYCQDVVTGYDKFRDKGDVMTKPFTLSRSMGKTINVIAMAEHDGPLLKETPDAIILLLTSMRRGFFGSDDAILYLILDGKRLAVGPGERKVGLYKSFEYEQFAFSITRDELTEIANAKTAEMRLGRSEVLPIIPALQDRFRRFLDFTIVK